MNKIILLEVASNTKNNFINPNKLEPLGIEYVGASIKDKGYEVDIFSDTFDDMNSVLEHIKTHNIKIVGISSLTYSFKKGLQIAKQIRNKNKYVKIVFGGVHASSCPEIIKEDAIDYVIAGEGERQFLSLLDSIINAHKSPELRNKKQTCFEIDDIPNPIRKKEYIKASKIYGLIQPIPCKQKGVAQIIRSRGCKYNCDYCSSSLVFGNKTRYRNTDYVIKEIRELIHDFDINLLYVSDINFNNSKEMVMNFCHKIIKGRININWYCLCHIKGLDQQVLESMKKAGCAKIGVGIETLNPSKIELLKKIKINDVKAVLSQASKLGLLIRGFFMLGFPWENMADLTEMPKILNEMPLDELRIPFFTPFPGTKSNILLKDKILTNDYDKYSTNESILKNEYISPEKYLNFRHLIFKKFYTHKNYHKRIREKINKYPYLKESYNSFFEELSIEGIL